MLPIEIRNQLAFKKAIRLAQKTVFSNASVKLWTTHVRSLDMDNFQFEEAKTAISKALLSSTNVFEIIKDLHRNSNQIVLEDKEITLEFIRRCQEGGNR